MCKYDLIKPQTITNIAAICILCAVIHITVWLTKSSLFPVTVKPRFPKKSRKAVTFHFFFFFFNSSQYALHPWFNFLLLFGLTISSKCERSLPLRHDWTSAPGKLPFWPERDVIGHDLVSYPTWRRLSANSGINRFNNTLINHIFLNIVVPGIDGWSTAQASLPTPSKPRVGMAMCTTGPKQILAATPLCITGRIRYYFYMLIFFKTKYVFFIFRNKDGTNFLNHIDLVTQWVDIDLGQLWLC